ncbi:putative DsbA family dithiol-disulfide isomerase [Gracilibacillus halotolerans]|uniref:Putative DsbA family dithiol-disulfide isomerase n=1 Tax=Gracilibacillus halotolerans TaxID=74386 RepID=A0A841RL51_9BACI|nr:DsbA family oxidoreductase [Gracilibacillus halotolerans]MBB6513209.1 putative DsbA family dithiol-disulfide isomerase [Gracilibacillus halotolerans]
MKVEIWSDFVCPFCYIGKTKLEQAIERFPEKLSVEKEYKSFQLDPQAKPYDGTSIHESLAAKYNMSVEKAKDMNEQVGEQAKMVGLDFVFDTMKHGNTLDAHRLTKFAKAEGKEEDMVNHLLYSYFTLSIDISNHEALLEVAGKVGLDTDKARAVLEDDETYKQEVNNDISKAQSLGITGVPFFVFNGKYAISGAQPLETFMQALEKVAEEENQGFEDLSSNNNGSYCDGNSCSR